MLSREKEVYDAGAQVCPRNGSVSRGKPSVAMRVLVDEIVEHAKALISTSFLGVETIWCPVFG